MHFSELYSIFYEFYNFAPISRNKKKKREQNGLHSDGPTLGLLA
jgi:hypothetical protein